MANTLTSLIPNITLALDKVARELVGFIPAVGRNSGAERVALNQSIVIPLSPAATEAANTPGVTAPDTGDNVVGNTTMSITKSYHVPVRWNGEQAMSARNAGFYDGFVQQQFEQGFRRLTNLIEIDLAALAVSASRGYGTISNAPFNTAADLSDVAGLAKILDVNGCPREDRQLVLDANAMFNLRAKQSSLFKVNEAGSDSMLRNGLLDFPLQGFAIRNSAGVATHTAGTGTGYLCNHPTAGTYAVGTTAIAVDTGSGTVLAGDLVTFTGDANKYVVASATAGSSVTLVTLAAPGLIQSLANNVAMTIVAVSSTYTASMAFHRDALQLATRLPAMPEGGDSAEDSMVVTDPTSGLSFEIASYGQFLQRTYHVRIAWGTAAIKPEFIGILVGT